MAITVRCFDTWRPSSTTHLDARSIARRQGVGLVS